MKRPIVEMLEYRSSIMAFAAFWILCSHSIGAVGGRQWEYLNYFRPFIAFGWGGVDIFLFLSGLGIALSLNKRPSLSQFLSKRFNRIYPAFFIAVTIEHIIYNTTVQSFWLDVSTLSYWSPLLGIQEKNTFWYVSAIFAFYLISYPYYKYCFSKWPLLSTIIISVLGLLLYQIFPPLKLFLGRIPIFFIGMYSSLFLEKEFKTIKFVLLSIFCYCLMSLIAWLYGGRILSDTGIHFIFFIFITPGLIILLSKILFYLNNIKIGGGIVKLCNYLGTFSLEIYLTHWIILCTINTFSWNVPWGIFIVLSFISAYIIKSISNGWNKVTKTRVKYL